MDLILSLFYIAVKVIFKMSFSALAKLVVARIKERIAPISSRDDSDVK